MRPLAETLHLAKHHGAGNDFLVLVDVEDRSPTGPPLVRALCDRRFGVGADGVIRILGGRCGADLSMELRNADGGPAPTSGNGLRCLAQAAVAAGLTGSPSFVVSTAAGLRAVEYRPGEHPHIGEASVDMGEAVLGPDLNAPFVGGGRSSGFTVRHARQVDMGNPHLVLLVDGPGMIDVAEVGDALQGEHRDGINVEFISVGPEGSITLRVWERGVGETRACGTGSAAAAAAAHSWGLVGEAVDVHNPGGTLGVVLRGDGVTLGGPVRKVADIEVDGGAILAGGT